MARDDERRKPGELTDEQVEQLRARREQTRARAQGQMQGVAADLTEWYRANDELGQLESQRILSGDPEEQRRIDQRIATLRRTLEHGLFNVDESADEVE